MTDARPSDAGPAPTRPYGSWISPLRAERVASAGLRLSLPQLEGGTAAWLEGRPAEGGRQVVMTARPGEAPREASPPGVNVRTRVHEYGGGDYLLRDGELFYVDFAEQRLHGPSGPLVPGGARYADPAVSPDGRWLVAVEERPRPGHEPENRLVAVPLPGGGVPRVVAGGHDFVSSPRFSPDGARLVFLAWDHPDMPWDATVLYELDWLVDGPASSGPRRVAGGPGESVLEPVWSPAGALTFASDRSGWWNLVRREADRLRPLCPRAAEFSRPHWVFGMASYAYVDDDTILCRFGERGRDRLARLDVPTGRLDVLPLPHQHFAGVRAEGDEAACLAGGPDRAPEVLHLELRSLRTRVLRRSADPGLGAAWISRPEALSFPSEGDRTAHAFFYPPRSPAFRAPEGERPPLIVKSHGGPTGATAPVLDPRIQFWTTRGFAVVDVNYGGSSGYGRSYRELLRGRWGIVDVEDCVAAARHLAERGRADGARTAITGGSAGGYTTLCALAFHDVFRAGASHYGVGDLEALARDTHKFESRYLDRLVAPWPEGREVYRRRSPLHHADGIACPVIFFQGLEDRVVPPNQAEAMVAALARRGVPHAYVPFAGEQHGFRRAANIRTALEAELWFYGRVFGFEVDVDPPEGVEIAGGPLPGAAG